VAVAAAEAYDAALGLDPVGLLCIRRLSLLAATSLLFGHGGVGGTSLASQCNGGDRFPYCFHFSFLATR